MAQSGFHEIDPEEVQSASGEQESFADVSVEKMNVLFSARRPGNANSESLQEFLQSEMGGAQVKINTQDPEVLKFQVTFDVAPGSGPGPRVKRALAELLHLDDTLHAMQEEAPIADAKIVAIGGVQASADKLSQLFAGQVAKHRARREAAERDAKLMGDGTQSLM